MTTRDLSPKHALALAAALASTLSACDAPVPTLPPSPPPPSATSAPPSLTPTPLPAAAPATELRAELDAYAARAAAIGEAARALAAADAAGDQDAPDETRGTFTGFGSGSSASGWGAARLTASPLKLGTPQTGSFDPAIVRRFVTRHASKLVRCYEQARAEAPTLHGTVRATFLIGARGEVLGSTASGVSKAVSSCVAEVIAAIEFPKPPGSSVKVVYPMTFTPIASPS